MPLLRNHRAHTIRAWSLALAVLLSATLAWAGSHRRTASHMTQKSPAQVWDILTDYPEICGKGCRYERPNLVRVTKLGYQATDHAWYTWSHVENTLRDVTYFSKVTVSWNGDGTFTTDTLQLDGSHKDLIASLKQKTGLDHHPAFDTALTRTIVKKEDGKTKVTQKVELTASGMLELWPGKIMDGIVEHMNATFRNIGP